MALDKSTLVTALMDNVFNPNVLNPTDEQTAQINAMANAWATAIDTYIKSATVTSVPVLNFAFGSGDRNNN